MLKNNKKMMLLTSILTVLPMFIGLLLYKQLPDTLAVNFDSSHGPTGFAGKPFVVFLIPLLLLAIQWFLATVVLRDPRKKINSDKLHTLVLWIIPVISLLIGIIVYSYNLFHAM